MTKTIVSVSKKNNSVWRVYFYDRDYDQNVKFCTEKINPLLVWYYKLQKQKLCSEICIICNEQFKFYKKFFESRIDCCSDCAPEEYQEY